MIYRQSIPEDLHKFIKNEDVEKEIKWAEKKGFVRITPLFTLEVDVEAIGAYENWLEVEADHLRGK